MKSIDYYYGQMMACLRIHSSNPDRREWVEKQIREILEEIMIEEKTG